MPIGDRAGAGGRRRSACRSRGGTDGKGHGRRLENSRNGGRRRRRAPRLRRRRGGLVLALEGELRGEKEVLVGWYCYLITSTDWHILIVLQKHSRIKMFFWGTGHRGAIAGWQQLCNTFWLGAGTAWQADWIWYYTLKLYQDYIHLTYTDGIRPLRPLLGQPGNLKNKAWKSRLGKAISYLLNHWPKLTLFCQESRRADRQ